MVQPVEPPHSRRSTDRDPSENVLALVEASMRRQDDLRAAETKHRDTVDHLERTHRREMRRLLAKYHDEQVTAEAARINAILTAQNTAASASAIRAELIAGNLAERVDAAAKILAAESGVKEQRGQNSVTIQQLIGIAALILGGVYFILSQTP